MTYNEWRDELKNNLLTVTDAERRHVLDYYAEAYADRREAGYTEREIIEGFGAPYDAAQRILGESSEDYYRPEPNRAKTRQENADTKSYTSHNETEKQRSETEPEQAPTFHEQRQQKHRERSAGDNGNALFVVMCVLLAIPTFALIMAMGGITIGLLVAPFSVVVSGIGTIVTGIGAMFSDLVFGALTLGGGIVVLGVGIMLFPLCIWLAKLMWKLLKLFFKWLKQLCSEREKVHE